MLLSVVKGILLGTMGYPLSFGGMLELNKYQELGGGTAHYKYPDAIAYTSLALCGEAGELANKVKKSMRAGTAYEPAVLMDELGDVLWYVQELATRLGYKLEEVAQFNLDKLQERRKEKMVTR
jgi:NTP pyrophosphatase (non-canonical NTP hydrolase)